jgi:hypothetical protein
MKTSRSQTNSLSDNSNYVLYNISNYKPLINNTVTEILNKFVSVIVEYMQFIADKITVKNKLHYKFIFQRGIETLIHVFIFIFYYTKNLELTFYHTQKAFYFYIEFIEQISDDNITFLQLSSRDAIMFVYKKTIFDINNEYKKKMIEPSTDEQIILTTLETYTHIYKIIIQFIIHNLDFNYDTKQEYINTCCNFIVHISENLNKNKLKKGLANCIHLFITLLSDNQVDINVFFSLLENFSNKICKKKYDEKIIKSKIYDLDIHSLIANNELNNIIDLIFTD